MSDTTQEPPSLAAILEEARELAERLDEEKRALLARVHELEERLARVQQRPEVPDDPGDPVGRLEAQLSQLEAHHRDLAAEQMNLERQNSNYLSLYVASSQIHATLDFDQVLRNIKEIIINLIGADHFAIYAYGDGSQEFRRVAGEGPMDAADDVIMGKNEFLSEVVRGGTVRLDAPPNALPSGQRPRAVLPLKVGEQPIGLVMIHQLLVQKADFDAFDMELFDLLAAHAAAALMSASMYRRLERKNKTLRGLLDLFKSGGAAADVEE